MNPSEITETLRRWRRGKSQETIAREAGVSWRTVMRVEHAECRPTVATARKLAPAYGVTLEQFLATVCP